MGQHGVVRLGDGSLVTRGGRAGKRRRKYRKMRDAKALRSLKRLGIKASQRSQLRLSPDELEDEIWTQ